MQIASIIRLSVFFASFILLISCERAVIREAKKAMRPATPPGVVMDDLPLNSLAEGIDENIRRLKRLKVENLTFGPRVVSKDDYILALDFLARQIRSGVSKSEFFKAVVDNFDFYEVYGKKDWGEVFITSYFHPVIPGSRTKTPLYSQPLYSVPSDLVRVELGEFVKEGIGPFSSNKEGIFKESAEVLWGRLVYPGEGMVPAVLPYYTRKEIDSGGALEGRNLELAWVDPIDAFFMHIQGSGTVRFGDGGEIRLGYAARNGYPFVAISRYLVDVIPGEKMSMQAIENYLRGLPEEKLREILNKNPSYIFFKRLDGEPLTSLGTRAIEGRTIATDPAFFPKGALAYMEFLKPVFANGSASEPVRWERVSRFVLDQDTGSAIRGPYRVDLYWGKGKDAARYAGVIKGWGHLYYLVPKDSLLQRLRTGG